MGFGSGALTRLKTLILEWRKGDQGIPKIANFLVLNQRQQQELKDSLIAQQGKWFFPVPETIPGKMHHGYERRVLKGGFTDEEFLNRVEQAGDDSAKINVDKKYRIGMEADYFDPTRNTNYPVRIPIHSSADGSIWVDSVFPVGLRDPNSLPSKRRKKKPRRPCTPAA